MADNFTSGSSYGDVFATNEIGDVHYPRTKLVHGAPGTAIDVSEDSPMPVKSPSYEDPILDHDNGVKVTVEDSNSSNIITPPPGTRYIRIDSTQTIFLRTDGESAEDSAGVIRIHANVPEVIPVVGGVTVTGLSVEDTATVYATPYKDR